MHCLGRAEVTVAGQVVTRWGAGRARELMAYALLHRNHLLLRDVLQEELWPDGDPGSSSLRVAVHTVRNLLSPAADVRLESHPGGYLLEDGGAVEVDADQFSDRCTIARRALAAGDPDTARTAFEEAMELYRGDLLPGLDYPWAHLLRERYRADALDALANLSRDALQRGDEHALARTSSQALDIDPYNERCYRTLAAIHSRRGDQSQVDRWSQQCCLRLAELGRLPQQKTLAVMQRAGAAVMQSAAASWDGVGA